MTDSPVPPVNTAFVVHIAFTIESELLGEVVCTQQASPLLGPPWTVALVLSFCSCN